MKRLLIAILPFFMLSCNGSYTIFGDAPEGVTSVVLSQLVGKNPVPVDTVEVEYGKFLFKGKTENPFVAYLSDAESGDTFTDLCVCNADIYVLAEDYGYDVVGGKENDRLNTIQKDLSREQMTAEMMYSVMDSAITLDPSSTAYSYVLFRMLYNDLPLEMTEKLEARFTEEVRANSYLTILRELIAQTRRSMPGNAMLDFVSSTPSGDTLSLSSLKGKWVLLDFWASWCPYCRKENPLLVEAYERFHQYGFEIFSVSLDKDHDNWTRAIEDDAMPWFHVSDLDMWECKAARMYGISAIPGNVLISPEGVIAERQLHGNDLIDYLENIFKQ